MRYFIVIAVLAVTLLTPQHPALARRPTADYLTPCALEARSASLDGTIVMVRGEIETGFEQSVVRDAECPTVLVWVDWPSGGAGPSVSLTFGSDTYAQSHEWAEFAPVSSESEAQRYVKGEDLLVTWQSWPKRAKVVPRPSKNLTMLEGLLRQTCPGSSSGSPYSIVATVTGRFDHVPGPVILRTSEGKRGALLGYGHMSSYENRLVLESVVKVNYRERSCR